MSLYAFHLGQIVSTDEGNLTMAGGQRGNPAVFQCLCTESFSLARICDRIISHITNNNRYGQTRCVQTYNCEASCFGWR